MFLRKLQLLILLVLFGGLVGCGNSKPTGGLSGTVTLNGENLPYGQVVALDEKSEPVASAIILNGVYELTGIPVGSVSVVVNTHQPGGTPVGINAGDPNMDSRARQGLVLSEIQNLPEEVKKAVEAIKPIPLKYSSTKTAGFTPTVTTGITTFNIEMTGKGEIPRALPRPNMGGGPPPPMPPGFPR